jgi:hypothetical protein
MPRDVERRDLPGASGDTRSTFITVPSTRDLSGVFFAAIT